MSSLTSSTQQGQSSGESQEEDVSVLRDVLDELDRERSQRAELEAKVRTLLDNEDSKPAAVKNANDIVSRKEYIALKTEKEGLVSLLDTLLSDTPAFQHAAANPTSSLPLHALRLLEIMPWDSRARQHAIGKEELYEWQFYSNQRKQWVTQLRQFPPQFRNLPVIQPKPGQEADVHKKGLFGDLSFPPRHVVLTNEKLSCVINVDAGYPLPEDATWQWVAGWRVDRHVDATEKERSMDCDDQGWSYATKPSDFSVRELCWDGAGTDEQGSVIRQYRRRRWTRKRVLVSYPNASQPTLEYLRLLAENMRLGVSVTKLSDQLVETKTALTEKEAVLLETREERRMEEERLKSRIKKAETLLNELGLGEEMKEEKKESSSLLIRADSIRKEQAEKIQKVWKQSSWHGSNKEDEDNGADQSTEGDQRFDWKRIARGPFASPTRGVPDSPSRVPGRKASLSLDEEEQKSIKTDEAKSP